MTEPPGSDGAASAGRDGIPVPVGRLRALRWRMLALLWCLVTPGAIYLVWRDRGWLDAGGIVQSLRAVRLEQWVAIGLIGAHAWFIQGALRSRRDPGSGESSAGS